MSRWNHNICAACYAKREPGREPHRVIDPPSEQCCFCGQMNSDGIYYRADPGTPTLCKGVHEN